MAFTRFRTASASLSTSSPTLLVSFSFLPAAALLLVCPSLSVMTPDDCPWQALAYRWPATWPRLACPWSVRVRPTCRSPPVLVAAQVPGCPSAAPATSTPAPKTRFRMSHLLHYFYTRHFMTLLRDCMFMVWVTKVSVPINIIIIALV